MTDEQKVYFLQGYLYRMAEEAQEQGLFSQLSTQEIVMLYITELAKNRS